MAFKKSIASAVFKTAGNTFWKKITVTSSSIKTATATDITTACTGELAIVDIIARTDATGLAGGTNFQILCNNVSGPANVFVETVANMGANIMKSLSAGHTTGDLTTGNPNPTVTANKIVLESGKKLQVQNSVAVGTGAGVLTLHILFERITDNADIAGINI